MHNIASGAIQAALYDDELEDEVFDDEEMYLWEPSCVDDCEMCGCHGECDPEDRWEWAIHDDYDPLND